MRTFLWFWTLWLILRSIIFVNDNYPLDYINFSVLFEMTMGLLVLGYLQRFRRKKNLKGSLLFDFDTIELGFLTIMMWAYSVTYIVMPGIIIVEFLIRYYK